MLDELKQSSLDVDVELGVKPNQNLHPPEIRMDNIQRHRKATPQFPNQTTTCGVLKLARRFCPTRLPTLARQTRTKNRTPSISTEYLDIAYRITFHLTVLQ